MASASSAAFVTSVPLSPQLTSFALPKSPRPCRTAVRLARRRRAVVSAKFDAADVGSVSLIAGTMVGAGVLALPAVSQPSGFIPATCALLGTWLYMAGSAVLTSEVAVQSSCTLGRPNGVSLLSQARLTLGPVGATISSCSYIFLHYAVLVAYISQGATIVTRFFPGVPSWLGGFLFLGSLSFALYRFSDEQVDTMNSVLLAGVIASFVGVVAALVPGAHFSQLLAQHSDWLSVPRAVPTMLLSCVYHNIVGSVSTRLGDPDRVRNVILVGSGVPLVMFLACNAVVLASATGGDASSFSDPLEALREHGGMLASLSIEVFSGLAVATSALGFVEGLNQIWNDARISLLHESPARVSKYPEASYAMSVIPPVVLASLFPGSFLAALDIGGLYGVSILFGVLPAAMAWRQRYSLDAALATSMTSAIPGGRLSLAVMLALPTSLILYNTLQMAHVI